MSNKTTNLGLKLFSSKALQAKIHNTNLALLDAAASGGVPGSGTVTSVGLSISSFFTITNSPVTGTGTLTATWNTQLANKILSGPTSGGAATPTFRLLVEADIPSLTESKITGLTTDLSTLTTAAAAAQATANAAVPQTRTVSTSAPLTGGGDLTANRTLTFSSQTANTVLAGPTSGGVAAPGFRALVAGDIPTLTLSKISDAGTAAGYTAGTSAGNVLVLDGGGKVPTANLPSSVLGAVEYQGTWNANTNSPAIAAASSTNKGWYYKVSVAGTTTIDTINDWGVGDWIVSNGSTWDKIDNSETVSSVNGQTGAVSVGTVTSVGISAPAQFSVGSAVTSSGNISISWVAVTAHTFLCGATSGGTAAPTFRAIDISDLPTGSSSATVCIGNDSRLSDARTPTAHATSHKSGGTDAIKLDELAAPTDVTTLNVSTTAHGLCPKAPNDATKFLDGTGAFTTPAATPYLSRLLSADLTIPATSSVVVSDDYEIASGVTLDIATDGVLEVL